MGTTSRIMFMLCCLLALVGISHASNEEMRSYKVERGDNLTRIALKFGLPGYDQLVKANNIANPNLIYAGQLLKIPNGTSVVHGVAAKPQVLHKSATNIVDQADMVNEHAHASVPFFLSEVVLTTYGPAHVLSGLNVNRIRPRDAIALLFDEESEEVRNALLELVHTNDFVGISVGVGERYQKLLVAEGTIHTNVLQAQLINSGLPAQCYALENESNETKYLLVREMSSGNWYGEKIQGSDLSAPCSRDRTTKN